MIACPKCKGKNLEHLKPWIVIFCKDCDFEFKGTLEEMEVMYE